VIVAGVVRFDAVADNQPPPAGVSTLELVVKPVAVAAETVKLCWAAVPVEKARELCDSVRAPVPLFPVTSTITGTVSGTFAAPEAAAIIFAVFNPFGNPAGFTEIAQTTGVWVPHPRGARVSHGTVGVTPRFRVELSLMLRVRVALEHDPWVDEQTMLAGEGTRRLPL